MQVNNPVQANNTGLVALRRIIKFPMKIQNKLFLFLFGFSFVLVSALVVLMQWSIGKGMVEYVLSKEIETFKPVLTQLSQSYAVNNDWRLMRGNHRKFRQLILQQQSGSDFESPHRKGPPRQGPPHLKDNRPPPHFSRLDDKPPRPGGSKNRPPPPQENEAQYALLDINDDVIVGSYLQSLDYVKSPISVDNDVVGYFAISKRSQLTQGYEVDFLEQQQHSLWIIALLAMLIVALVTFPLARHIVEPIKLIARGMHKLTQGNYQQSINLKRQDELYELSRDYNELALTLAENETARKRWLADISHELRTPVAILRGELEAMIDQVRPLSVSNLSSVNDEVKHLQHLIDDLNILTSTDVGGMRYRKEELDFITLIKNEAEKYTTYLADAEISLQLEFNTKATIIYADKNRLIQLFENIINNSIKYSSASQMKISITLENRPCEEKKSTDKSINFVIITFSDNGVGVDECHLPHLFEHLYRVEDSRNRKTGGSGLGLSICRQIVIAHQGEISAQRAESGGLNVIVSLPVTAST